MISCCALSSNSVLAFPSPASRFGRSGRVLVVTTHAISSSGGHRSQPVELPGGATWWLGLASASAADELLYGPGFTICRPNVRTGQPGLVRSPRPAAPTRYAGAAAQQQRSGRGALVPLPRQRPGAHGLAREGGAVSSSSSNLALDVASGAVVIDTEFELVEDQGPGCLSIVPLALETEAAGGEGHDGGVPENDKHPRRTMLLRFTCLLCDTVNTHWVSPHAWRAGSVFCRCSGCTSVHKLADNLNIFSETREVFPPRELRATLLSPEVQRILERMERERLN